jgi:hypothetical protein
MSLQPEYVLISGHDYDVCLRRTPDPPRRQHRDGRQPRTRNLFLKLEALSFPFYPGYAHAAERTESGGLKQTGAAVHVLFGSQSLKQPSEDPAKILHAPDVPFPVPKFFALNFEAFGFVLFEDGDLPRRKLAIINVYVGFVVDPERTIIEID